jgi:hypothetical protein
VKDWGKARDIYKRAVSDFHDSIHLQKNLEICEQRLKKARDQVSPDRFGIQAGDQAR